MSNFRDQLKVEGVRARGYGVMPKMVVLDRKLTIEAKAIYAYFVSYSGAGNTSFPSRDKICEDLCIGVKRYYNHFNLLTELGYVTVEQVRHNNGKFKHNIYTLVENPVPLKKETPCIHNDHTDENVDNKPSEPCSRYGHTDDAYADNDHSNSNTLYNINTSLYNQSFIQSKNEGKKERKKEGKKEIDNMELKEILKKADINEEYLEDNYKPVKRAIESLYYRNKPLIINDMSIPVSKIRKDLEDLNFFHVEMGINIFKEQSENQIIRNRISYLAACIYNAMFDMELKMQNDLRYHDII